MNTPKSFTAALIQTTSGREPLMTVNVILPKIKAAVEKSADFVMLPETVGMMETDPALLIMKAKPEDETLPLQSFRNMAAKHGIWILIGSLVVQAENSKKLANRSFLIDHRGIIRARYDKIHLFDAELSPEDKYKESTNYRRGEKLVVTQTPWGILGMTICYDLRFPHLYRGLSKLGARFLSVPSAFTNLTGQAHWHILLRARAIENGCFVFAPAQCGKHDCGRHTFGHSLVVDPWGEVIADAGKMPGMMIVDIDVSRVDAVRAQMPSLRHDRNFE